MVVLLALNWLTVVQPFVWVYIKQPAYTSLSLFANASYLFEYVLQILNVLCFIWVLRETYRKVVHTQTLATA